jgi:hypothetical protein
MIDDGRQVDRPKKKSLSTQPKHLTNDDTRERERERERERKQVSSMEAEQRYKYRTTKRKAK